MEEHDASAPRRRGRPPGREGAVTREWLLDTALRLFAEQGYAATSIRQIAAEVGMRDSAIYGHFAGKRAMYDALFAEAGPPAQVLDLGIEGLTESGPREAVGVLAGQVFAAWSAPRARLFLSVILRETAGDEGLSRLTDAIESTRDQLAEPFGRWQEAGLIRSDLEPRQLVWELFAPMQVPRVLYLRGDASDADVATARRMVDDHVEFFLRVTLPTQGES